MTHRFLAAALAMAALAAAALAVAFAGGLWTAPRSASPVVQFERVVIVGKRVPASAPLARAEAVQPAAQRLQ